MKHLIPFFCALAFTIYLLWISIEDFQAYRAHAYHVSKACTKVGEKLVVACPTPWPVSTMESCRDINGKELYRGPCQLPGDDDGIEETH